VSSVASPVQTTSIIGAQITTAIKKGTSMGVAAGISSKIFFIIKFLNVSYSHELEDALKTWTSNFISFGWEIEMSNEMKDKFVHQPSPYVFAKHEVPSSFFVNFWSSLIMLSIVTTIYLTSLLFHWLSIKAPNKYLSSKALRTVKVMIQNYLWAQMYEVYGGIVFFSFLEWKSIVFSKGLSGLSFGFSIIFLLIMLLSFGFHFNILFKYQETKKKSVKTGNQESLTNYVKKHEGAQVLFSEFKDNYVSQQAFLLILVAKDICYSFIITVFFEYPLTQTILILILNIIMCLYLITKRPFKNIFDEIQQFAYEFLILIVSICVLIMAGLDTNSSLALTERINMGKVIIIVNLCFNFVTIIFLGIKLLELARDTYYSYKEKRSSKKVQVKPQKIVTQNESSLFEEKNKSMMNSQQELRAKTNFKTKESFVKKNFEYSMDEDSKASKETFSVINSNRPLDNSLNKEEMNFQSFSRANFLNSYNKNLYPQIKKNELSKRTILPLTIDQVKYPAMTSESLKSRDILGNSIKRLKIRRSNQDS